MNKALLSQGDYDFAKAADRSALSATKSALLTTSNTRPLLIIMRSAGILELMRVELIEQSRSPSYGRQSAVLSTHCFSNKTSVSDTLTAGGLNQARLCVDPSGWLTGARLGVRIDRDAALSSVQVVGEGC